MGIRARLVFFIVGVTVVVILAWGVTVVNGEAAMLRNDAADRGIEVLQTLAVPCALALVTEETERLEPILSAFRDESGEGRLMNVAVLDATGTVVAHSNPERVGETPTDEFTVRALEKQGPVVEERREAGRRLFLSMPLLSERRLGTATAEVDLTYVETRIQAMSRKIVLGSALMAALGALALWVLISSAVLRPLEAFSETALRISRGDLTARVAHPNETDELGLLASVFNQMVETLQGHTASLEGAVQRRTEELRTANRALGQANEDLAQAVSKLERLASTDGLTGLFNHRAFQETLAFELLRAKRNQGPLSLLMIDVDHFKAYNDNNGHPAGDQVLIQLARILKDNLRQIDVIARYGGEEFAILLLDTPQDDALGVGQKLRDAVRDYPFAAASSQPEGRVTISVGVAAYPLNAETGTGLVSAADKALYAAKKLGRDQVVQSRQAG